VYNRLAEQAALSSAESAGKMAASPARPGRWYAFSPSRGKGVRPYVHLI
jgi:hypothetical protein